METIKTIKFDNVTFTYPLSDVSSLNDVSFSVEKSEFIVLCGKSGCGKTTLLRHMKKNMMPYGNLNGEIIYDGVKISDLSDARSASEIGYVQQNPDNQLVTDKVWHELAFGLESLGLDNLTIKRRVAEMASYFDIQTWFRKDVSRLSGGQKQLLNLASIMVMQPELLVLDEPTSQLDPIAASEFLNTVYKINRDLGTTVILSEHRLEDAFTMADRVMVMDSGRIVAASDPREIGGFLAGTAEQNRHPMFYGLPAVAKIFHSIPRSMSIEDSGSALITPAKSPLTIREGRLRLDEIVNKKLHGKSSDKPGDPIDEMNAATASDAATEDSMQSESAATNRTDSPTGVNTLSGEDETAPQNKDMNPVVSLSNVWFRYEKNSQEVLRDLSMQVNAGELFCVLGGNGVGKSTMLKAITGIIKIQRGRMKTDGRLAMLPQNPQALFTEISVEDELMEALHYETEDDETKVKKVLNMLAMMEIPHLRKSHPYDLSGGEQQRLALGKILLPDPDIILLDEPTKGLDPFFKISLAKIFKELTNAGKTLLTVSHDIEFCAEYGDRCAMFFDGGIVSVSEACDFFSGNNFYTTVANKIAREHFPDVVTWEEVTRRIKELV